MLTHRLKPMLPTLVTDIPINDEWVYEIKYDGYRALLYGEKNKWSLCSRNLHSLNPSFPELIAALQHSYQPKTLPLPFVMDGEVCILESDRKSNFEVIQQRGRLKNELKIKQMAEDFPATYLAFDLLQVEGNHITHLPYTQRKAMLAEIFQSWDQHLEVDQHSGHFLQYIPYSEQAEGTWNEVKQANSEGIIAKHKQGTWISGVRSRQWLKIKNWKVATFILLAYDKTNAYFHVGVMRDDVPYPIGLFSHGIQSEEKEVLVQIMKKNAEEDNQKWITVSPGICLDLQFIDLYKQKLREPRFLRFRFDKSWEECTWESVLSNIKKSKSINKP